MDTSIPRPRLARAFSLAAVIALLAMLLPSATGVALTAKTLASDPTSTPTVSALSSSYGSVLGGTTVTITGSYLSDTVSVWFGSTAATNVTVNSDTSVTAVSPPGTLNDTVDVTVITPSGTSATSSADQFTYIGFPSITFDAPNSGPFTGGTTVTLSGVNLIDVTAVMWGATPATSFTVNSSTSITAVSPPGTVNSVVPITVTTPAGTSLGVPQNYFYYVTNPPTTSTSASAASATYGAASVALSATVTPSSGVVNAGAVTFTIKNGSTTIGTVTSGTVTENAAVATFPLTGSINAGMYTIDAAYSGASGFGSSDNSQQPPPNLTIGQAPLVIAASSGSMTYGGTVPTITPGYSGFVLGGTEASLTTEPTCSTLATGASAVGAYASSCADAIDPNYSISYMAGTVTVNAAATTTVVISSLNPSTSGQSVTLTAAVTSTAPGSGVPTGTVTFNDGSATLGSGTLLAGTATYTTTSLANGSHSITAVYNSDGNYATSTSNIVTLVVNGATTLTVTGVTPGSVGRGATNFPITVSGTGFASGAKVTISGTGIAVNSTTFISSTSLKANITVSSSTSATSRNVTVTVGSTSATCTDCLGVNSAPAILGVSQGSMGQGARNQNVSIYGLNFESGTWTPSSVLFSNAGITVNSVTRNNVFVLTANISISPSGTLGAGNVTVINPDGGRATDSGAFTVTAALTVTSVSPASRGQGAIGQNIVITGTNFESGSWPTSSVALSGTGITVNSIQRTNSTHLAVNISISATASLGASSVTVTNPDDGVGSKANAFTVTARPTITSLSQTSGHRGSSNLSITVTGTGFVSGATVAFSGSGITVKSVTFSSSTKLTVVISLSSTAATGARNVTVTNPDAGTYTLPGGFTVLA